MAARAGQSDVVRYLIQNGAKVDIKAKVKQQTHTHTHTLFSETQLHTFPDRYTFSHRANNNLTSFFGAKQATSLQNISHFKGHSLTH